MTTIDHRINLILCHLLRLEETIVGGLAGTLVAFLVFPVSTLGGLQAAVAGFMDALDELVAVVGKCARAGWLTGPDGAVAQPRPPLQRSGCRGASAFGAM